MKFFIDTANLDQIREAQSLGVLDGVTTNPSLMAKEGITGQKNIIQHYIDICEIVDGDVSAEVIAVDFDGMVKEGNNLASLHPQIVVKIPMIEDGIKALKYFAALTPSLIIGNLTTIWLCKLANSVPSAIILSKSVAITSADTSPSTISQISL